MKKYKYIPSNYIFDRYSDINTLFENGPWRKDVTPEKIQLFFDKYKADVEKNNWDNILHRFDIEFGRISVLLIHILYLMGIDVDNEILPYVSKYRLNISVGGCNFDSFYKEVS